MVGFYHHHTIASATNLKKIFCMTARKIKITLLKRMHVAKIDAIL